MDSTELIAQLQDCLRQISGIRQERQAIGSSKVKAWKTEVEHLLRLGGRNTSKLLQSFQKLKFGASALGSEGVSSSEVRFQSYQAELDAAEKTIQNAVQTIQIFGVSEEQKLPDWFKQEAKVSGIIHIGNREVDVKNITVVEFLMSVIALSESDKSLDESLKKELTGHLNALKKHPLLQPFLNQTIDKVFNKF
ncbi:MAG TPA: hypothetical protein VJ521_00615 [Acidobacteriota bacterium]|nr:hypothetical protein [Acidobacteriota bacterium]